MISEYCAIISAWALITKQQAIERLLVCRRVSDR